MNLEHLKAKGWVETVPGTWQKGLAVKYAAQTPPTVHKRIRQSSKPLLNKLEQEWLDMMNAQWKGSYAFIPQAVRFRLGNGIWYKPDFICWNYCCMIVAWEVKGPHAFRGGFENLKVAATQHNQVHFRLTWKESGQWQEQIVRP